MRAYLLGLVGTFFLVLTIGLVSVQGAQLAPLAIGFALMVMVYAGGHVSGGHYNPAVSLGAALRGALPTSQLLPYWVAQLLGAVLGALVARGAAGGPFTVAPGPDPGTFAALAVETLFTFALVTAVPASATAAAAQGNPFYGLATGGPVAAAASAGGALCGAPRHPAGGVVAAAAAGGAISGGAFNPAVGVGAVLVDAFAGGAAGHVWLYVVGPLLGGALAAAVFSYLHPEG